MPCPCVPTARKADQSSLWQIQSKEDFPTLASGIIWPWSLGFITFVQLDPSGVQQKEEKKKEIMHQDYLVSLLRIIFNGVCLLVPFKYISLQ